MSLIYVRELYMKMICNTIVYRMSVWHISIKGGQLKGLAKALFIIQLEYLYIVIKTYRTIPIYCLKKEIDILLIDIYFNKRIADFERRLMESGMTELINNSNTTITIYLYNRHLYRHLKEAYPETGPTKTEWANKWLESDLSKDTIYKDWKEKWR